MANNRQTAAGTGAMVRAFHLCIDPSVNWCSKDGAFTRTVQCVPWGNRIKRLRVSREPGNG